MRILIIEDDVTLCDTLVYQLKHENINTDVANDGDEGLSLALENAYDLILLDRMLPLLDGLSLLQKLRQHVATPVILLTALGTLNDRIEGLNSGADDYLVKPFAFEELIARIRTVLRRPSNTLLSNTIAYGNVTYDISQNTLSQGPLSCTLSKREGDLLEFFMQHPRQTLPRTSILLRVWGADTMVEDGNLDNYIHFIRRRLRQVESSLLLTTVRGIGYRLEENND